jgi:hypothetical protein
VSEQGPHGPSRGTPHRGLDVGDVVGERFRLIAEIAEGGMGRVFEADDLKHDRRGAVKLIHRRLAADDEFRARFQREAQVAEHASHPNVLPVWDHGEEAGYLYLATPLANCDLIGFMKQHGGRLDLDLALTVCEQVAWALDWAHARTVLHRDVKPENVLLVTRSRAPHCYLADFGLARMSSAVTLTQAGKVGLTPSYAAPEQWQGARVTGAADQYALAGTLYCCLAGHAPFAGKANAYALRFAAELEDPPSVADKLGKNGEAISRALCVGLAKSPEDRYESCEALITAVREAAETGRVTAGQTRTEPEYPVSEGTLVSGGDSTRRGLGALTKRKPPAPAPPLVAEPQPVPDGAFDVPRPAPSESQQTEPRRRVAPLVVGLVALAVIAVAAVAIFAGGGENGSGASSLAVGKLPADLASDSSGVWVANQGSGTVSTVDPKTSSVTHKALEAIPSVTQVAVGDGQVWAISAAGDVAGLSTSTGDPLGPHLSLGVDVYDAAVGHGALWVADGSHGQVMHAAITGDVLGAPAPGVDVGAGASSVAISDKYVWVAAPGAGRVSWIDPESGKVAGHRDVEVGVADVAVVGGDVWAANPQTGTVTDLNASDGSVRREVKVPTASNAALVADGSDLVYVDLDHGAGQVITPATGKTRAMPKADGGASSATVAAHKLWLAYPRANSLKAVSL